MLQENIWRLKIWSYHNDHLGTPQKMTDASGTVVWSADYKPFGEATVTVSTITNNLRFPGQCYDAETGTLYNYFRDYDPAIGRYKQADPIGLKGGINQYRYVRNNSINSKDVFGLRWAYQQSTGEVVYIDDQTGIGTYIGNGYSGNGIGLNNSSMDGIPFIGPIPDGTYFIGPAYNHPHLGANTMDLTPSTNDTTVWWRDLFRIHGDNRQGDHSASQGCVVLGRDIRSQIANSNDRVLQVIQ